MPNGGHICCEYCTYNRLNSGTCDIWGIRTSPFILCRAFRVPKQSHTEARKKWQILNELKSGFVYGIDNSSINAGNPIEIYRVIEMNIK
ncbi:MAG TPA: hypothetical protein PK859_08855 [Spirochaetota bacterium]|nr:hypothetical protein [Spirochaetota bacterium]HPR49523.1 hypothetical protein [Spirochaetota bacterium]